MTRIWEIWAAIAVDPKSGNERLLSTEFVDETGTLVKMNVVGLNKPWVERILNELVPEIDELRDQIRVVRFTQ